MCRESVELATLLEQCSEHSELSKSIARNALVANALRLAFWNQLKIVVAVPNSETGFRQLLSSYAQHFAELRGVLVNKIRDAERKELAPRGSLRFSR